MQRAGCLLLHERSKPGVDPLGPENNLIFSTGVLTGTMGSSTGRYEVVTRAPLNGTLAGSNSGGYWGPELKYAGYDMVILKDSRRSLYISIFITERLSCATHPTSGARMSLRQRQLFLQNMIRTLKWHVSDLQGRTRSSLPTS